MYVAVDREEMKFVYKHTDLNVVINLMWIEYPRQNLEAELHAFGLSDAAGLNDFTDLELKMLYRNTTGGDHSDCIARNAMLQIVYDLAEALPANDVNPFEVECQAAAIKEEDLYNYRFAGGSTTPAKVNDLYDIPPLKANSSITSESSARKGETPAVAARRGRDRARANTLATSKTEPIATSCAAAPKRGSAKVIIWEVADAMWAEAGSPLDKAEVLELRKKIMTALLDKGIQKTTSSSQLGNWHKARAPF